MHVRMTAGAYGPWTGWTVSLLRRPGGIEVCNGWGSFTSRKTILNSSIWALESLQHAFILLTLLSSHNKLVKQGVLILSVSEVETPEGIPCSSVYHWQQLLHPVFSLWDGACVLRETCKSIWSLETVKGEIGPESFWWMDRQAVFLFYF